MSQLKVKMHSKLYKLFRRIGENPRGDESRGFSLSATGGTRTHNLLFRRIVLYPLSYSHRRKVFETTNEMFWQIEICGY